jgi:mannitol/fructose-specific phosphotransferase system IIA component (Ntr-type)
LRKKHSGLESERTVRELVNFAKEMSRNASHEFGYIQNPLISNLLTEQHVLVNSKSAALTKEDALSQLAAPHARMYGLDFSAVLAQVQKKEQATPVILREGFAIAHGVMDKTPRISLTFGIYPSGIVWDDQGRRVTLVAMMIFATDTYGTYRDYLKKLAIVFRANPNLQLELVKVKSATEFLAKLRQAELSLGKP